MYYLNVQVLIIVLSLSYLGKAFTIPGCTIPDTRFFTWQFDNTASNHLEHIDSVQNNYYGCGYTMKTFTPLPSFMYTNAYVHKWSETGVL
jgi:hypothetical protein